MTTTCTPALHPLCSRIISWRERTLYDDYAANAEEPIIYKRTAGYVWASQRASAGWQPAWKRCLSSGTPRAPQHWSHVVLCVLISGSSGGRSTPLAHTRTGTIRWVGSTNRISGPQGAS